jgi:hypothetical protein
LGAASPYIVVPGEWTDSEIKVMQCFCFVVANVEANSEEAKTIKSEVFHQKIGS